MAVQLPASRKRELGDQNPVTCMYNFANMDFGASSGNTLHYIGGPAGMRGVLKEVGVALAEATVFATTLGIIQVGTTANSDAFGILNIPTAQAISTIVNAADDTDAIIDKEIPANTCVLLTLIEGTGAGLTGQGHPYVIIDWY